MSAELEQMEETLTQLEKVPEELRTRGHQKTIDLAAQKVIDLRQAEEEKGE